MIEKIKNKAKELLKNKQIEVFLGYKLSSDGRSVSPAFIYSEEEADALIWDTRCAYNLSTYFKELSDKKVGIVAKGCDIRSILVLLQENQIKRENVFIVAVECPGVIQEGTTLLAEKCGNCKVSTPEFYDILISAEAGKEKKPTGKEADEYKAVSALESKSAEEKLKLWRQEFSACIRCYACRQVCPMCYCRTCVAEQTMPVWFSKASNFEGNFSWHITRAMHLAGRCIDCGECERACPVGIPLRSINKKIEKDILELFKYQAGAKVEQKPLLSGFDKNDPADFIK